jgi:hypothetical protein
MKRASILTGKRYAKKFSLLQKIFLRNRLRLVGKNHPLSCFSLYRALVKIPHPIVYKSRRLRKLIKSTHALCKLTEIMLPFTAANKYVFTSANIEKIKVSDSGWESSPGQIEWDDYWTNIHMPGLEKWCFPKIEEYS